MRWKVLVRGLPHRLRRLWGRAILSLALLTPLRRACLATPVSLQEANFVLTE